MAVETIWSDISHTFSVDSQGAVKVVNNIDSVLSSIYNIIHTRKGERVMRPEFGSGLGDLLFENMTQDIFDLYTQQLKQDIETWDDRILVDNISVTFRPDQNSMSLKMSLSIRGYDNIFEFSTDLVGG